MSTPASGWRPGSGIAADLRRRWPWYRADWVDGLNGGTKMAAPALYMFFASALPALAFGQQLAMETEGTLNVVHVLAATALAGLTQSIFGGQPLLIQGVAEPIVLIYGFLYSFARSAPGLGAALFLPWAAWVCVWTGLLCCALALAGACAAIDRFTRFSGELFGALIAILFLQVGIKGIVHEFFPLASPDAAPPGQPGEAWQLTLINGLWSLCLALGLLLSCLWVRQARSWVLGRRWLRALLADYGVPIMVVAWSGISFAVTPAPHVPRRVLTPDTWQVTSTWTVAGRMGEVPGPYIAAALLPAAIITVLFYFDHNVSSQLAQQPEFNLARGSAYHYDFLVLSLLTLACGLLGLPPVNGVLPQAPMHTRSLAHIGKQRQQQQQQQLLPDDLGPLPADMDGDVCSHEAAWPPEDHCANVSTPTCRAAAAQPPRMQQAAGPAAVTDALSQLQLGTGAANAPAASQEGGGVHAGTRLQTMRPVQQGVAAVTTALSRLQLGAQQPPGAGQAGPQESPPHHSPAAAASGTHLQQPAVVVAFEGAAGTAACRQAALRHRSPHTASRQGSSECEASDSIVRQHDAPFQQHQEQQQQDEGRLPPMQQQQQRRRGLHPTGSEVALNTLPDSAVAAGTAPGGEGGPGAGQAAGHQGACCLQLEVCEQRLTNLVQALLVACCLAITPAIKQMPTGVLWGYFMLLAATGLEGSQLWERLLLLATDPARRVAVLQQEHAAYLQLVPFPVVVRFTLLQLVCLLAVWALTTWGGVAGVAFPLPIMALVPLRQYVLPRLFQPAHLAQLDAASYEAAPAVLDKRQAVQELLLLGAIAEAPAPHLPVTAPGAATGGDTTLFPGDEDEDEADVLSQEFRGLQLKHHLTRRSLEAQQQGLRRRPQ